MTYYKKLVHTVKHFVKIFKSYFSHLAKADTYLANLLHFCPHPLCPKDFCNTSAIVFRGKKCLPDVENCEIGKRKQVSHRYTSKFILGPYSQDLRHKMSCNDYGRYGELWLCLIQYYSTYGTTPTAERISSNQPNITRDFFQKILTVTVLYMSKLWKYFRT